MNFGMDGAWASGHRWTTEENRHGNRKSVHYLLAKHPRAHRTRFGSLSN